MTKEFVHTVLKEHAEANMPAEPDLWPAIRNRVLHLQDAQAERQFTPQRPPAASTLRLAGALAAALIAIGAVVVWTVGQPAPVSAAELLERAEKATVEGKVRSFHGILVSQGRNNAQEGYHTFRTEKWYLAPANYRSDTVIRTPEGEEDVAGFVSDGESYWAYETYQGKTLSLKLDPKNSRNRAFGAPSLETMLGDSYFLRSFYAARVTGSETVAGRMAHVVELRLKPREEWPAEVFQSESGQPKEILPIEIARMQLWVDKDAFFVLRSQSWDAEGNHLSTSHYESFEIDVPVDPRLFSAEPPPGVGRQPLP